LTVGLMRCLADSRCVALETDLAPLPRLDCFPAKLNLVVQNLVSNAIDACRAGGRVVIRTRSGIGYLEIKVDDTGCGIDPAIRDKVFDPFFTTKPIGQGTGLGLSMSYGVVKEHHGTVEFESVPGQGTRFVVRLPVPAPRDLAAIGGSGKTEGVNRWR
jgi:two-component system, NtrC family, sensor kinase